jgi:hypothetical protein
MYMWARARVGTERDKEVGIGMNAAYAQSGAGGETSKFRTKVAEIVARNALPGYALRLDGDTLTMTLRRDP